MDKKGHLAVFCSAGVGNLLEFVCCDIDKVDFLIEYFKTLEKNVKADSLLSPLKERNKLQRNFSIKIYITLT